MDAAQMGGDLRTAGPELASDGADVAINYRRDDESAAATAKAIEHLCTELNETETVFPGTNLRLISDILTSWGSSVGGVERI